MQRTLEKNSPTPLALPDGVGDCGGHEVRINNPVLSLFAASLMALTPVNALAQTTTQPQTTTTTTTAQEDVVRQQPVAVRDRSRPEYDAPGGRLGGFNLSASLDFDVTSTDNLFAAPEGFELDDIIYELTPTARLESDWSRHALAVEGSYTSQTHEDFSNEDADSYYLRGSGRVDLGDSSSVHAAARAAHQVTPRTDPDSPLIGSPVEYDRLDASIGAQHQFARVLVRADAAFSGYDYEGAQDFRDNEETAVRGRVEVDVSPRIDLLLQAVVDEREYENTPNLDSEGRTFLVGAKIDGDLMSGEVSAGQFERDYADPSVGTFDGLAVSAALDWYITQLTTITLTGRQDADDQISANVGQPYVTTEFGARVDHELLRNLIVTASAAAGERDYESIDRNDDYAEVQLGVDFLLNPHAVVRFRYEHDESESSGALQGKDFEADAVTLGFSLRL
jgi:hypothetical protein